MELRGLGAPPKSSSAEKRTWARRPSHDLVKQPFSPTVLTAALIGTGKISEEHLKFLTASPRARVVGVCDLSPSLARYASERFGAGRPFTDYAAMLAEVKPDVVHVLTPPGTHVRLVGDCLRAGAHVIVEKPVAPTHAQFVEL